LENIAQREGTAMKRVFFDSGRITLQDVPTPLPGPGEVLVRVLWAGICNTDIELLKGYHGFRGVPGHEFVGVVESAPDSPEAQRLLGQRVTADINIGDGPGDARHVPGRRVLGIVNKDGAFAEYLTLPMANCHIVPHAVDNRAAVFAEPLAAALEVGQQVHLQATDRVAVLGDGKLGILIATALRHGCPGIVLIGKHGDKLAVASRQGVRTAMLQDAPALGPFDVVVEATGRPDGVETALDLVRPEGTIVLKTTTLERSCLDMARIVVNEIVLKGSRCGNIPLALGFLRDKLVDVGELVEADYPLERFEEAFALASRPGCRKVLLKMGQAR